MNISSTEIQMLQTIRARADDLARLIQEANMAGFNIAMNMNFSIGACDQFDVHKMVKVDLRGSAN
jgi:hypothetical protein